MLHFLLYSSRLATPDCAITPLSFHFHISRILIIHFFISFRYIFLCFSFTPSRRYLTSILLFSFRQFRYKATLQGCFLFFCYMLSLPHSLAASSDIYSLHFSLAFSLTFSLSLPSLPLSLFSLSFSLSSHTRPCHIATVFSHFSFLITSLFTSLFTFHCHTFHHYYIISDTDTPLFMISLIFSFRLAPSIAAAGQILLRCHFS